jgi:hypothetical protein
MKTKKPLLEKDIQRMICEWLTEKAFFFWRQNNIPVFGRNNAGVMTFRSQSKYTQKGLPDILVLLNGKLIGLEVKRDTKAVIRPEQIKTATDFRKNGAEYHFVYSLDDVKALSYFKD